jgi:hypothetical protein
MKGSHLFGHGLLCEMAFDAYRFGYRHEHVGVEVPLQIEAEQLGGGALSTGEEQEVQNFYA